MSDQENIYKLQSLINKKRILETSGIEISEIDKIMSEINNLKALLNNSNSNDSDISINNKRIIF